jgi:hypothetical protein
MAERHSRFLSIRPSGLTGGYATTGNRIADGSAPFAWRETRNGVPEGASWVPGAADAVRDAEVADQVAAARAEALRRAGLPRGEVSRW